MSAKVKKAGRIGTKIVAAFLFVFLVMFNVQIGMHDGDSGDINLLGLKLSLFTPSLAATGCNEGTTCSDIGCPGQGCCMKGADHIDEEDCWMRCKGGGYVYCM